MVGVTRKRSFVGEVFDLYDRWSSQVPIYLIILVLSTSLALVLDLQFGVPPAWVLLFMTPVVAILLFAVPAAYVAFCRAVELSASDRKDAAHPFLRSGK